MTESIITISPKTSPYRSQIQTRIASPGSLSSINFYISPSINRTIDHHHHNSVSNEKLQLRKLNDQFLSYIERIHLFETYNNCLNVYCENIKNAQERIKNKLDLLKQEFHEYQQEKLNREKKDIELENEFINDIEKQVEEYKNKKNFLQHEHELYRKQIIDLQQQSIDLQSKTEKLRSDCENLNDDSNHCRRQMSYCQLFKSSILDEITRQRDIHQRIQLEVDDLKIQKQLTIQAHEADTQAIEIQNDNILYDLTTHFRLDGNEKNILTQMLNEIREEYKMKDNEMREELHRKYLYEYNRHIKRIDENLIETNRDYIERHHLSNELDSLNDNRLLLRQKLTLIQEQYKQLEINFQRETKRQTDMNEKYDHEINNLSLSVREYENLLNNSSLIRQSTIADEVNKYSQLLEGSDQQIGLRQLINMSNKIDYFSPINYSTIPPINKFEPVSTVLLVKSRTRQNSTSETSYETAHISTTTTNQQYLTLDSVNEKVFQNDYDTDNDQSQTIQYISGRNSRLISETDLTTTNQESKPPTDVIKHNETIDEIPIDISHTEGLINQTLPFIPMNIISQVDIDENKSIISDEHQSPLISTFEKREDLDQTNIESNILTSSETIIPITIDINSITSEELNQAKIISPSTLNISINEQSKSIVSPKSISNQSEIESTIVEVPVSTLPAVNPLSKLISTMLPNATPFVPNSNITNNQSVTPSSIPILTMNNNAPPFIPSQHQHANNQQHMNNTNVGHWSGSGTRGNNRRGQNTGGGSFHHGGGGNQRSGGGGNWQQGGGQHKQRRGQK
ncbi:unnamed protein product [Rotaria sordida]|uniref:Uncharacterized protein n=1 Tax=Rotaria sordida TaxID=392033 RepID=A0A818JII7_9BILA|nr:unnamed protein product [Rotaria sordida]CAF3544765.1 unnamed protein product [Rotaria sordida]